MIYAVAVAAFAAGYLLRGLLAVLWERKRRKAAAYGLSLMISTSPANKERQHLDPHYDEF